MVWYENSEERFGKTGKKGDQGEYIVEEYLKRMSIPFEKKTDHHSQTVLKIDFIVDDQPMDVKTNIKSNFHAVELVSSCCQDGWLYTTAAEHIYAVDVDSERIFRYSIDKMKQFALQHKHKARQARNGAQLLWVSCDEPFIEQLQ